MPKKFTGYLMSGYESSIVLATAVVTEEEWMRLLNWRLLFSDKGKVALA